MHASDVWSGAAFSADAPALRQAADAVKPAKHSEVTVLLNELNFSFDAAGRLLETRHLIYRIENQKGVEGWAEVSGQWEAWHQDKPEIKARVMTLEGSEHWLDAKTLNDVPVHEDAPDLYSDERRYGGPLPAVAPGAIVEQQVIVRDTAPLFAAGEVERLTLQWDVPVNKTHVVISHPDSLALKYQVHLLPDAVLAKSSQNGLETITLDEGPQVAHGAALDHLPPDFVQYPEVEFSTGTSWQQVANEYARLSYAKMRPADVQPLLAKINLRDGSRNDVIRRIVAALHKNVRYTGVEFGESSLVPEFPSETLKRRYGDCKDKAMLLVAMLRSAGIAANLALLDTGPGREINPDLPGMGLFDHAIVYLPATGAEPELWIDATASYSKIGTLPWMDYGRNALVVSESTQALRQTPELTADQNIHREFREFTLAEYGMAKIVETNDLIGPEDADYRDYYSSDSKEIRENGESYVKDMYLADSLTSIEHGDLSDLEKPAAIKFTTTGKRGNTDLARAVVAIRVEGLFERVPKYFRTPEEKPAATDQAADVDHSEKPKPRTADWRIFPSVTEWRYKITAPLGFKLRALPPDKDDKIDTITFTQKYSANPEATVVEAVLRVENTTTKLTAQQAKDLPDAVVKARNADPIFITFDHVGQSLIAGGKIKEGLAAYRDVASQHPKEALHKVQLAQALLANGMGEEARAVALEATILEPNSAVAFSTLAEVRKNDLIGRVLKKGMDLDGAVTAYRKAMALDPKDKDIRSNLGLLLEYDAKGTRYGEKAPLKDAVVVLRELKKMDEPYSRTYDDNILYDLWYAHDPQGVLDYAATLPASESRRGLTLASITLLQGVDAALKKSLEITTDEQSRSQALVTAGQVLMRVRHYSQAAAILAEAARGQSNASQLMRSAAMFAKAKPYSELRMEASDPRSVVQQFFGQMLSGNLTFEEFKSITYPAPDEDFGHQQFDQMMSTLAGQLGNSLPLINIADLAVANMHYTVDGDDSLGYKIIVEAAGAEAQNTYVIRDAGHYKLVAFSGSGSSNPEAMAPLALAELDKNNLAAARKWLDRARDEIHMSSGDDPLAGSTFPHFWTKGQDTDPSAMRTAALVLLQSKQVKGPYLAQVIKARDASKTDLDRDRLTLVLADAYWGQQQWADMLPLAQQLLKNYPTSLIAFDLSVTALTGLKQYDEWDKLVQARIAAHPDELAYPRSGASLAAYRGQFVKSREIIKAIFDKGQATAQDLNLYAWFALVLPGPIDQDTIDMAVRGNDLTKNSNFAILHTAGCVYAQAGKTREARELLLKAMDAGHLEEPNSEVWFGLGLIAEQYGVSDAAEKMYARVEKPKFDYPATTYSLAQQHLTSLHTTTAGAKSAGH
jgi:tetratricopeptide (TPR) repeat protein